MAVAGDLDIATAPMLVSAAQEVLASAGAGHQLTLDVSDVGFCDSAGLSALIQLRKLTDERGGVFELRHPQLAVRRVLELSGLMGYLNTR